MRSSSKVSNPLFQPLIGSQEPPPLVLVPVIIEIKWFVQGKKGGFLLALQEKLKNSPAAPAAGAGCANCAARLSR